ncbi:MAG: hypothetical protein MRT15_09795 [archaeon YNP-LCB-003-016]|uniref:hypothetical protein n=1 Tax=Candidatus Culexarchaeum yellowstonense TaxID=2928963 RepID=UPI0026EDAC72|nr:hypothetical protein [Candidatus Culexarchaeum yellowstonense]MCR6692674.1 hypothetical protein [Candidatus Culexarchaeum yellowstonense]
MVVDVMNDWRRREYRELKGKCVAYKISMIIALLFCVYVIVTAEYPILTFIIMTPPITLIIILAYHYHKRVRRKLKELAEEVGEVVPWWI